MLAQALVSFSSTKAGALLALLAVLLHWATIVGTALCNGQHTVDLPPPVLFSVFSGTLLWRSLGAGGQVVQSGG